MTELRLIDYVKFNEGLRLESYQDHLGVWTIGYGHTGSDVGPGMSCSMSQATEWLAADLKKSERGAFELCGQVVWQAIGPVRRIVLTDMVFQMGARGVSKFHRTLRAIRAGEWDQAATAMLASLWARQTPNRARRNAAMMLTGSPLLS